MKTRIFIISALMITITVSAQQSGYRALKFNQSGALFSYEMERVHRENLQRSIELNNTFSSKESMLQYINDARTRFTSIVGELPSRGDLKAKVTGTIHSTAFNVEKIVFQSTPGRYVTAHLYLPTKVKGKVPACIEMCGHGLNGKGDGSMLAERLAVNGIASMVVDPIAQGERLQLIDSKGNPLTRGVTTEHTLLNPALCLIGSSLAAQEYFDNSRAIDYLCSRNDIDTDKIGAYGFSGGGTQSAYLIALDKRVKVGCIGLFFSSRERTLELMGPSDGCQWIHSEGRERIEIADMAMMMAPKPLLILDGKYDFVDHWGALQGFEELKKCYSILNKPQCVEQYYSEDGHACPPDAQEKFISWFCKWLIGDNNHIIEASPWRGNDMLCTKSGQVNIEYEDAKSVMQMTLDAMDKFTSQRAAFCSKPIEEIRNKIKELTGLPQSFCDTIDAVPTGKSQLRDAKEYRYQINCNGQMPVPCIVRIPDNSTGSSPIIIRLSDKGKAWLLTEEDRHDAVSDGSIEVFADLRGIGETADPYEYNLSKYWNDEYRIAVTALHGGASLIGQRLCDVRTLINFCWKDSSLKGRKIIIEADGNNALAVMHAVIMDDRITEARLTNTLKTWRTYLESPMQRNMMSNVIEGVLRYYDIPDIIKFANGRINITD